MKMKNADGSYTIGFIPSEKPVKADIMPEPIVDTAETEKPVDKPSVKPTVKKRVMPRR